MCVYEVGGKGFVVEFCFILKSKVHKHGPVYQEGFDVDGLKATLEGQTHRKMKTGILVLG